MPENDLPFEDLSPEEDEALSPEELEILAALDRGEGEIVPFEDYVQAFIARFGYRPRIKEHNAFVSYALMDFDEAWRDAAIEVEHEHT